MNDLDILDSLLPYAAAFVCCIGAVMFFRDASWPYVSGGAVGGAALGFYLGQSWKK